MIEKETLFYGDIFSQTFSIGSFYNPTRLIMLHAIISAGKIQREYEKIEIANFIFESYCNNKDMAKHHPNIEIREIPFYGINAIFLDLDLALKDWTSDAHSNILTYDAKKIYLDLDDDGHIASYVKKILSILFVKIFKQKYIESKPIPKEILMDDKNLNCFGKSHFRDLVFADMQYCVLCDECNEKELFSVHILNSDKTIDINELSDPNNGLLMCKEHAQMFNNNLFTFDERGRVIKSTDKNLMNARISNRIYIKRKKYLEKLNNLYN